MTDATTSSLKPDFSPFHVSSRSFGWQAGAAFCGTLVLALASYIQVPMIPVPMTMQTLAVTLIGALYGWRLGAITIVAWLAEAALGLPVLAGGASGVHVFLGPTGGYLFAFPIVGALTGWLAERGWNGSKAGLAFVAMILGNTACLLLGGAWLAAMIGVEQAFLLGVAPFILGGLLKSALGAATLAALAHSRIGRSIR
jgi:biotin transport system substrate-specific component